MIRFFIPSWQKVVVTAILFFLLAFTASTSIGRREIDAISMEGPYGGISYEGIVSYRYKLNPVLWAPAPLVTLENNYTTIYNDIPMSGLQLDNMYLWPVGIFYWIILSYLLSCFIVLIWSKNK